MHKSPTEINIKISLYDNMYLLSHSIVRAWKLEVIVIGKNTYAGKKQIFIKNINNIVIGIYTYLVPRSVVKRDVTF